MYGLGQELGKIREKAWKKIVRILIAAIRQDASIRILTLEMLEYERRRQKRNLEYQWQNRKINSRQKKEYQRCIQLYEKYADVVNRKIQRIP